MAIFTLSIPMKTISYYNAQVEFIAGTAVIIDVREHAEYMDFHLPGAINQPSTQFDASFYSNFHDQKICLICESGKRASQVLNKLEKEGISSVAVLETHMQDLRQNEAGNGWTVDRQFRMTLGLLLATFLVLYYFEVSFAVIIPTILASGLIITSIIDRCYMRMGIAMLPWNRNKSK